jgi:hypothetical protein
MRVEYAHPSQPDVVLQGICAGHGTHNRQPVVFLDDSRWCYRHAVLSAALPIRSYYARYWSTDGAPLVGNVLRSQSCRFEKEADARSRLEQVQEVNGPHCAGEIVGSELYPEIFTHCGRHAQAIGGRCPGCGKKLTVADAQARGRSILARPEPG